MNLIAWRREAHIFWLTYFTVAVIVVLLYKTAGKDMPYNSASIWPSPTMYRPENIGGQLNDDSNVARGLGNQIYKMNAHTK